MITVINKANKGLYNQLFKDVEEWLYIHNNEGEVVEKYSETALLGQVPEVQRNPETGEEIETGNMVPETLTSLEELFMFMRQITRFAPIYTRLPLDEEPFFINADSREITVPKDFAINGVSVQGDEVAEILFFKINRFFDATDLSQCKIFIQWKNAEADEFGNLTEGVSRPWIQDIESEPGYLIFGWPISSKITKKPGNITFSIRFYRLDQADKLLYSFSTLDQTVKIQPALDYDIEDIVNDTSDIIIDDMASDIVNRAISSPASSGTTVAVKPEWEDGVLAALYARSYATEYKADGNVKYRLMNLGINSQGFSNMDVTLRIAATSDDSGVVSYTWTKVNKEGVGDLYLTDEITPFYKAVDYIPTETTEAQRNQLKTYYWKDGNSYKPIPSHESLDDVRLSDKGTVYELVSTAILDEVGKYVAMAENRVGKSFSEALIADAIYVPMPVAPELGTLETQGLDSKPILDTDAVTLGLNVVLKDEFGNDVGIEDRGGKATYVWHRRGLGEATATDLVDTGAELILTPSEDDEEVTAMEGYYSVTVTNNLNKETADSESNEIRITKPAVQLVATINEADHINLVDIDPTVGLPVFVSGQEPNRVTTGEDPDTITYQWYRWTALSGKDANTDRLKAANGTYVINGDVPVDLLALGDSLTQDVKDSAHSDSVIPPTDGYYFCEITNHYNGTESKVLSPFYNVID